jgi:hypothetical protein
MSLRRIEQGRQSPADSRYSFETVKFEDVPEGLNELDRQVLGVVTLQPIIYLNGLGIMKYGCLYIPVL